MILTENGLTSLGEILVHGNSVLGLDVGIISSIKDQAYLVVVATINDHITQPLDHYSLKTGNQYTLRDTYCSDVIRTNQTLHYSDEKNHPTMQNHPCYLSTQLRAYIGTPLTINDAIFGRLNYSSANPLQKAFTKEEIRFIEAQARSVEMQLRSNLKENVHK